MTALYSILLKLRPENEAVVSPTQGHHAYALFLGLINQSAPALAGDLHKDEADKPFTISPLMGKFGRAGNDRVIKQGAEYTIRLTFLKDDIFAHFMDATYKSIDRPLRLGPAVFKLQQVCFNPDESLYCRQSSYDELRHNAEAATLINLKFDSPTVFRSGGRRNVLYPEPQLVFMSYLRKWQHFSPFKFEESLGEQLKSIELARHCIRTYILHFDTYRETGFEGDSLFKVPGAICENTVKAINTLADFAYFCGTGAKTTMGMGQTRRIK